MHLYYICSLKQDFIKILLPKQETACNGNFRLANLQLDFPEE